MSNETPPPVKNVQHDTDASSPVEDRGLKSESVATPPYDLVEVPARQTEATPSAVEPGVETSEPGAAETRRISTEPKSAEPTSTEPDSRPQDPQPRPATSAASMQTVYVPAPVPPIKKGNRGFGVLIALLSTVIFAGLYALIIASIRALELGVFQFDFFGSLAFYTPAIFFFVGFVIVVLLANRASWWGYVLGSIFVALFVYFGTVATGLLVNNIVTETPSGAARLLSTALFSPFIIAAALLAREVSMWMGALISARGRRVKVRNLEARDAFDRESADRATDLENSRYDTREVTV